MSEQRTTNDAAAILSMATAVWQAQMHVQEFHQRLGLPVGEYARPGEANNEHSQRVLRLALIEEELRELRHAVATGDKPEIADALADLLYVVLGAAVVWGYDLGLVMAEVHASNLAKEGGPRRADGKALKPEGWKPPDVAFMLELQRSVFSGEVLGDD